MATDMPSMQSHECAVYTFFRIDTGTTKTMKLSLYSEIFVSTFIHVQCTCIFNYITNTCTCTFTSQAHVHVHVY